MPYYETYHEVNHSCSQIVSTCYRGGLYYKPHLPNWVWLARLAIMSKRRYCNHCGEFVSKSVFYEHQLKSNYDVQFEFTPATTDECTSDFEFNPDCGTVTYEVANTDKTSGRGMLT